MLKTTSYSLAARAHKILFSSLENKIHIFALPCNILFVRIKVVYTKQLFYGFLQVWKTLVEHQAIIKERGETIDDLEVKLTKAEARHSREKATLENTVAKMKEVMETKGGDRKKQTSRITELESKAEELQKMNDMLISGKLRQIAYTSLWMQLKSCNSFRACENRREPTNIPVRYIRHQRGCGVATGCP